MNIRILHHFLLIAILALPLSAGASSDTGGGSGSDPVAERQEKCDERAVASATSLVDDLNQTLVEHMNEAPRILDRIKGCLTSLLNPGILAGFGLPGNPVDALLKRGCTIARNAITNAISGNLQFRTEWGLSGGISINNRGDTKIRGNVSSGRDLADVIWKNIK